MPPSLTLDRWDQLTSTEQKAHARGLSRNLPDGFRFSGLRACRLGTVRRRVAEFTFDGATFVLIPGGPARLGYPATRPWTPTPAERASWNDTAEEYDIELPLRRYIASVTRRPRRVNLRPVLLETTATEPGWSPADPTDRDVKQAARQHLRKGGPGQVEIHSGEGHLRVRRGEDGSLTAERAKTLTHAGLVADLRKAGFRLPTDNEWEYTCDAGAGTLFRWGDHVPCDRYPTDVSTAEAEWRRKWVLSGGKLAYPKRGFQSDWERHRQPNGFGLSIASNPYHCELLAEPGRSRGGDGGNAICGGVGFFVGWLTLATAYYEDQACAYDPSEPIQSGYVVARRVLPLD